MYVNQTHPGTRGSAAVLVIAAHIAVIYAVAVSLGVVESPKLVEAAKVVFIETPRQVEPVEPVAPPERYEAPVDALLPEPVIAEPIETAPVTPPVVMDSMPVAIPSDAVPVAAKSLSVTRRVDPLYPPASRRMEEQGAVLLRVLVDERGRPTQVVVAKSSGFDRLDDAAVTAVRRWQFAPAMEAARAVSAWTQVNVVFRLDR